MAGETPFSTRESVEAALTRGFASLQSRPCMTMGPRLVAGHAPPAALALNWVADFVPDPQERKTLMQWVRCQAREESWADFCRNVGWQKRTEDMRRGRAVTRIVAGLNAGLTVSQPAPDARLVTQS